MHKASCLYKRHKGGILIEFTFSIPICIILLFFVNDHYRIYELKHKLKSSAYLAASMVQQLTNNRSYKRLTTKDLARITFASCLNLFHTNTMFNPWPFGIFFAIDYDWLKKLDGNNYQWNETWATTQQGTSPDTMYTGTSNTKVTLDRLITVYPALKSVQSELVCYNEGEEKLIISCYFRPKNFNKSKIGLFLINLVFGNKDFGYHLVITPKPGLFPIEK